MFVGHFGIGLAAKAAVPRVSLGTLFLSVQLADARLAAPAPARRRACAHRAEHHAHEPPELLGLPDQPQPSRPSSPGECSSGPSTFVDRRFARGRRSPRGGVVSHWVLDVVTHRPDMPVLPRGPYVGLGLWNSAARHARGRRRRSTPPGSRSTSGVTRAQRRRRDVGLGTLLVLLAAIWLAALFGPPPPSERALAWTALPAGSSIPWAILDRPASGRPFRQ